MRIPPWVGRTLFKLSAGGSTILVLLLLFGMGIEQLVETPRSDTLAYVHCMNMFMVIFGGGLVGLFVSLFWIVQGCHLGYDPSFTPEPHHPEMTEEERMDYAHRGIAAGVIILLMMIIMEALALWNYSTAFKTSCPAEFYEMGWFYYFLNGM